MKHDRNPMPILDAEAGLTSLESICAPKFIHRLMRLCLFVLIALTLGVCFLPWQQLVRGNGRVIAYDPLERIVVVEAPLSGRVAKSHVRDGIKVSKGDLLFELEDNDPELQNNLNDLAQTARQKRDAIQSRVNSLEAQLREKERALPPKIAAAEAKEAAMSYAAKTAALQYNRIKALFEDDRGLVSQRSYELALLERDKTNADWLNAKAELQKVQPDGQADIESTRASLQSARSDLQSAEQSLRSYVIKVNQTNRQQVVAPRDGIVQQIQITEGNYLKEQSPLCTIIPITEKHLAEIYVKGNDMPLLQARKVSETGEIIQQGSHVRLQFEGWPAVQVMGWPSVALGSFGGEVILIDPAGNAKGEFRVLVAPDPETSAPWPDGFSPLPAHMDMGEDGWPGNRWLRQGVRTNAWILLRRVPLWFELWRQINGFPPLLENPETSASTDSKK